MTALADLKAAQTAIEGATVDTIDALYLAASSALKVPSPPGDPSNIEMLAATLRKVAGNWNTAQQDLTVVANVRVPAMWQGETMTLAKGLITNAATDLAALPAAFDAAARALDAWARQLTQAQHQYEHGWSDLNQAVTALGANLNDPDRGTVMDPNTVTSLKELFPSSHKAALDGIDQMVGAASAIDNAAQSLITLLNELATTGIPAAPGAAPVGGATAALTALGAPPPDLANAVSEATDAANLITLQNSGGQLTPAEQARLNDELNREADNPLFATTLLQDLGPDGFLNWANRAENNVLSDPAGPVSAATVLAAATGGVPGGPTLPESWISGLKASAAKEYDPNQADLYGYQIIGMLMGYSQKPYSGSFLQDIGNGMVSFELAHGGATVWRHVTPGIEASGDRYDPIYDLLLQLKGNPAAANSFLSEGSSSVAGLPQGQVAGMPTDHYGMLDFLLDRKWQADSATNTDVQMSAVGDLIDAATANTGDMSNRTLAKYVVGDLGEHRQGNVPSGAQAGVTDMLVNYIRSGDVNSYTQPNALFWSPTAAGGSQAAGLDNVLVGLSKNKDMNSLLAATETAYTYGALHLARPNAMPLGYAIFPDPATGTISDAMFSQRMGEFGTTSGHLLGLMARGQLDDFVIAGANSDAHANQPINLIQGVLDFCTNSANTGPMLPSKLNEITSSGAVVNGTDWLIDQVLGSFKSDTSQQALSQGQGAFALSAAAIADLPQQAIADPNAQMTVTNAMRNAFLGQEHISDG